MQFWQPAFLEKLINFDVLVVEFGGGGHHGERRLAHLAAPHVDGLWATAQVESRVVLVARAEDGGCKGAQGLGRCTCAVEVICMRRWC